MAADTRVLRSKIIGAKIRKLRTELRYSLKGAAELIGVSSSVLSSYETGKKAISLPELELLACHFETTLSTFLGDGEDTAAPTKPLNPEQLLPLRQRMIGARLRERRNELDLSLRDVGRDIGIPASRLSDYERGNKPIPLPELEALAQRLVQKTTDYADHHGPMADKLAQLSQLEAFQSLSEDLREFLLDPANLPYVRLAHNLSSLSTEDLRILGEGMVQLAK